LGGLTLLTPSCGGQSADREEKRVAHGNAIPSAEKERKKERKKGRKEEEQLDFKHPNQRRHLEKRSIFCKAIENACPCVECSSSVAGRFSLALDFDLMADRLRLR
jgi:hypothetical protein